MSNNLPATVVPVSVTVSVETCKADFMKALAELATSTAGADRAGLVLGIVMARDEGWTRATCNAWIDIVGKKSKDDINGVYTKGSATNRWSIMGKIHRHYVAILTDNGSPRDAATVRMAWDMFRAAIVAGAGWNDLDRAATAYFKPVREESDDTTPTGGIPAGDPADDVDEDGLHVASGDKMTVSMINVSAGLVEWLGKDMHNVLSNEAITRIDLIRKALDKACTVHNDNLAKLGLTV